MPFSYSGVNYRPSKKLSFQCSKWHFITLTLNSPAQRNVAFSSKYLHTTWFNKPSPTSTPSSHPMVLFTLQLGYFSFYSASGGEPTTKKNWEQNNPMETTFINKNVKTLGFSHQWRKCYYFLILHSSSPKMWVPENLTFLFEFNQLLVTWEMRWTRFASQKLRELRVSVLVTENYSGGSNTERSKTESIRKTNVSKFGFQMVKKMAIEIIFLNDLG